jgi:hypothetical protein
MEDRLLIDGDIIAYYAASAIEYPYRKDLKIKSDKSLPKKLREEVEGRSRDAEDVINGVMGTIFLENWSTDYKVFLTGTGNFRNEFSKDHTYKANRKGTQKPILLPHCRDFLVAKYDAVVSVNEEADDLIAIEAASMDYDNCVVVSTDKDFLQLPCWNYNWRKTHWIKPTPEDSLMSLYMQMLMGDAADNVKGVKNIGPKKAEKLLMGLTTEVELYKMCLSIYKDNGMTEDELIENARMLYLRRKPREIWEPPV